MRYEKAIMSHIPENTAISIETLFEKTRLKNKRKFYFVLRRFQEEGFVSLGVCNDVVLIKSTEHIKHYLKQRRKDNYRFWIPVIISILALIGAYRQESAWLIQAITQLWK